MLLLRFLPDSFILYAVYAALGIGLAGIILGSFFRQLIIQLVSIVIFCAGVYWYGGYSTEMEWRKRVADMEAKVKESEERAPIITKEIVTKYKDLSLIHI